MEGVGARNYGVFEEWLTQKIKERLHSPTEDILGGMVEKAGEVVKEGFVGTVVGIVHIIGFFHPDPHVQREAERSIVEATSEASAELKNRVQTTWRGIGDVPAAFAELAPEAYEALLDLAATKEGRRQVGRVYTESAAPVVGAVAAAESLPALVQNTRKFVQRAWRSLDEAVETAPGVAPQSRVVPLEGDRPPAFRFEPPLEGPPPKNAAPSKRLEYMGKTPGKASRTGREVIERMKQEGRIIEAQDGGLHLVDQSGKTVPLTATDMGHLEDAVKWWNREGYKYGPKADPVRQWMRDPKNYEIQPSSINRSKGAQLPDRYRPPEEPQ